MGGFISTYVLEEFLGSDETFDMNKKYKCIAVCGNKGHGKTTAGNFIKNYCRNKSIFTTAFAEPLKKGCQKFFDLSNDQLEEKKEVIDPRWNISPRDIFVKFGTELMREDLKKIYLPKFSISFRDTKYEQENFWVIRWLMKWNKETISDDHCVIITDLRFSNEYDLLRKEFGDSLLIIRVKRTDISTDETYKHKSETETQLIKEDILIENDMSDKFFDKIQKALT